MWRIISSMNKPTKPTGEAGVIKLSGGILGTEADFQKLEFPDTKDEIEAFIVKAFMPGATKCGLLPDGTTVQQNKEQDLDFTLRFPNGDSGELELMEIAQLEEVKGSYSDAPPDNKPYESAERLFAKIMKKSNKYGLKGKAQRHLLIYVTDWKFVPSMTADKLLRYWLATIDHNFGIVFQFMPVSADDGPMLQLYPTNDNWKGFDPDIHRQNRVTNLDPNKLESGRLLPLVVKGLLLAVVGVVLAYIAVQLFAT